MSPEGSVNMAWYDSFPRVSGDEPYEPSDQYPLTQFSPRERG